jgi:signal transduction histidine kinase
MISRTDAEIRKAIQRDTRYRFIVLAALLMGAGVAGRILNRPEIFWAGLLLSMIELATVGLVFAWLKWDRYLFVLDHFVIAVDIIVITLGLHFLGGVEFPFDWIYAVALVAISISRGLATALFAAVWSILCYGTMLLAEFQGYWAHMALFPVFARTPLYNDSTYVLTKFLSNVAMFIAAASTAAFFSSAIKKEIQTRTRELKEAQAQLLHSQKLATLGQMAASLAHGLASPITGIRGSAELLMDELAPDHPGQRRLQGILHWADHLSDILKRLRNLARPPKEERDLVNLNQIVDNVLELNAKLLAQNEIQIRRALTPNLPPVWGSARMLEEVFMNLVINAKDAMPKGGTLDISTVVDDAKVLVHVQDTGVGMSPEVKEHVFEAFFTTKGEKGSGLGLNICRQIVVDHNGQISVESIEGQGSTFTVRLPLSNGANA